VAQLVRAHRVLRDGQWQALYLTVQEEQGGECLFLRGRRDPPARREVGEEALHVRCGELARVPQGGEAHVAAHPRDVCLLGVRTVMPYPQHVPDVPHARVQTHEGARWTPASDPPPSVRRP
jgi:hypothetical protein